MPEPLRQRTISTLRLVLGAILIYAAYVKIAAGWLSFAASVGSYEILPDWAVIFVANWLPWFELVLGLLVVSGFGIRWTGTLTTVLLTAFFAAVTRAYIKGLKIDCGCFGPGEELGKLTLVRDGSFLAMAALLTVFAFWPSRRARLS